MPIQSWEGGLGSGVAINIREKSDEDVQWRSRIMSIETQERRSGLASPPFGKEKGRRRIHPIDTPP
jgi:hypothetical protein